MNSSVMWQPTTKKVHESAMWRFMQSVNAQQNLSLNSYRDLYKWSIDNPEKFWEHVWHFCDIKSKKTYSHVQQKSDIIYKNQWFKDSKLNFAENLLKYCQTHPDEVPAIIFHSESGERKVLTYEKLYHQVASLSAAMRYMGINSGDRVAGYLPNIPETIVAMLATTSLGAIWSSCSPDFGYHGVLERFGQIKPKILFTADAYTFKGKKFDSLQTVRQLADSISEIEKIIVVPFCESNPDINDIANSELYTDLIEKYKGNTLEFTYLPFDHPLYIMFSSGTTGIPKCIVHGSGGTLIQHLKELVLHTDLKPGDRLFYYTTCGWMMWNWMVSGLAAGATLVLYDGSPFHPHPASLIDIIDKENVSVFGCSAKYISALDKANVDPINTHDLPRLRTILSTGSPLVPESFDYVYKHIKTDLQLASISGGTDIISCFALGNPLKAVHRGELQGRGLGMAVEVFNEDGDSVRGEKGELVCTAPFPSMPIGFWNDDDNTKYHAAYFSRFENIWAHGDFAEITDNDGLIIYGRSDAVLNPGGVRIGTAEIYQQVEKLPEILESIAIGQEWKQDVRVILFVKLRDGLSLDKKLINSISNTIRTNTTPRHVPAKIIQVNDIPRTISGKIVELAVRNVVHHQPVKNTDALANPEALDQFRDIPELEMD